MTIIESIKKQFKEELGEVKVKREYIRILQMKYGLIIPQLTPSEKYLIQKDERNANA